MSEAEAVSPVAPPTTSADAMELPTTTTTTATATDQEQQENQRPTETEPSAEAQAKQQHDTDITIPTSPTTTTTEKEKAEKPHGGARSVFAKIAGKLEQAGEVIRLSTKPKEKQATATTTTEPTEAAAAEKEDLGKPEPIREKSKEEKAAATILWLSEINREDTNLVGGKNASLGEMFTELSEKGIRVPNGFAVTAKAYYDFIEKAQLKDKISDILKDVDTSKGPELEKKGEHVRRLIIDAPFPEELNNAITEAYRRLEQVYGKRDVDVAVRSSATAEDLPEASFAGQQDTYLNIRGEKNLLEACKRCMASLFTGRAISYRKDMGFDQFSVGLSISVQKMVRSDKAASGVMFSIDTESGFQNVVLINASWGLGENVVQGSVNPDEYYVFKPTLFQEQQQQQSESSTETKETAEKKQYRPIIGKNLGSKEKTMIYASEGGVIKGKEKPVKNIKTPKEMQERFCLTDDEVLQLASWACMIEDHYSRKNNKYTPMDMEFAKDGETNELFVVQARPETVHSQKDRNRVEKYRLKGQPPSNVLCTGKSVGSKIGAGKVHVIKSASGIGAFKEGEVLVTEMTDPDWESIMKIASAIITDRGGRTCHAAIISREIGVPCLIGCNNATSVLKNGREVTVDCSCGETGVVYDGKVEFEVIKHDVSRLPKLKTKIMINIANPGMAFSLNKLPNEGVGLIRMEFTVSNHIKAHPLALIHLEDLKDKKAKKEILQLIKGYDSPENYFVSKLAQGIGTIAAAFWPKPVILRFSDFKTNEYANLLGGAQFEPQEDNPMLGWRGASRYYDDKYADAFGLECKAVKVVREEYGLRNLNVMVPFCRTVDEAQRCIETMAKFGLSREQDNGDGGGGGLKVYCMCEIPSNVILAEEFLDVFDGFSIGSNDLTQLVLGVDRDSEIVARVFDERNEAVKRMIRQVIQVANKKNKYISICGEAPSTFPDFAEFLVEEGIQSISLNPDSVLDTYFKIYQTEKKLGVSPKQDENVLESIDSTSTADASSTTTTTTTTTSSEERGQQQPQQQQQQPPEEEEQKGKGKDQEEAPASATAIATAPQESADVAAATTTAATIEDKKTSTPPAPEATITTTTTTTKKEAEATTGSSDTTATKDSKAGGGGGGSGSGGGKSKKKNKGGNK